MADSSDWEALDNAGEFDKLPDSGATIDRYSNVSNQVDTQFSAMSLGANNNSNVSATNVKVQILRRPNSSQSGSQPKLLKRPSSPAAKLPVEPKETPSVGSKSSTGGQPVQGKKNKDRKLEGKSSKTLSQRELDYAAAREKIFGKNPAASNSSGSLSGMGSGGSGHTTPTPTPTYQRTNNYNNNNKSNTTYSNNKSSNSYNNSNNSTNTYNNNTIGGASTNNLYSSYTTNYMTNGPFASISDPNMASLTSNNNMVNVSSTANAYTTAYMPYSNHAYAHQIGTQSPTYSDRMSPTPRNGPGVPIANGYAAEYTVRYPVNSVHNVNEMSNNAKPTSYNSNVIREPRVADNNSRGFGVVRGSSGFDGTRPPMDST